MALKNDAVSDGVTNKGVKIVLKKFALSLRSMDFKLYLALLFLGFCPAVYSTVRVFLLGRLPDAWAYSIAGQLSWVNLLYEILGEAILLPLFFFIGRVLGDKREFANRVKSGLLLTFCIYTVFSILLMAAVKPMLSLMAAGGDILEMSAAYIRIESVANIFGMLSSFVFVALVTLGKSEYMYILTAARLLLCLVSDVFFVSSLPVSLRLGVNGIGYSNIWVNAVLFAVSLRLLCREGVHIFRRSRLSFGWIGDFFKIGGLSGLESLVRNLAYMLMIVRMVNVVNEQGVYWVANGFIWNWLLFPITQLGELIKREISTDRESLRRNSPGYFGITAVICAGWLVTIPLWKPFMRVVLGCRDTDKLFSLVLLLLGFYVLYAFQNVFDATFYGLGKTNYMLFESIVTNSIYYGTAFILYSAGLWTPTLGGIALLFGCGIAFDSVVSFGAYVYLLRKCARPPEGGDSFRRAPRPISRFFQIEKNL